MLLKMKAILIYFLMIKLCLAEYRCVCYYASWSIYRKGNGHFNPELIDPNLCTHLIYAFVGISENGIIKFFDPWNDVGDKYHEGQLSRLSKLKETNPNLKLMLACGGWNFGSRVFSKVVNNCKSRQLFIKSIIYVLRKYKLDGFDLDWEYPGQGDGAKRTDKFAFTRLIKLLKNRLKNRFILSAALSASPNSIDQSYELYKISKYLNFINIMSYDLHGAWENVTGHHSPLNYGHYLDNLDLPRDLYDVAIVNNFLQWGVPAHKINLGVPFYARTFTLKNEYNYGFGAPVIGPGKPGTFYQESGSLGYNEICTEQSKNPGMWRDHWDHEQKVPYSIKGNLWAGYDDAHSLALKAKYIKKKNLGGVMVWSIDTDDFSGTCFNQKFPLLNVLNEKLQ